MYGVTGIEFKAMSVNPDRLLAFTDQVHLDPTPDIVIEGMVHEGLSVKITRQFVIDTLQQIQIERGGDAAGIVVGRVQNFCILLQIHADQQITTLTGDFCKA